MEFISNLFARFFAKPEPVVPSSLYSDAEFLEVVAKLARQRTLAEQAAAQSAADSPQSAQPGRAVA